MNYHVLIKGKRPLITDLLILLSNPAEKTNPQIEKSLLSSGLKNRLVNFYKNLQPDGPTSDYLLDGDKHTGALLWIPGNTKKPLNSEYFRNLGYTIVTGMKRVKGKECMITVSDRHLIDGQNLDALVEGIELARYSFNRFKTKTEKPISFRNLTFLIDNKSEASKIRNRIKHKKAVIESVNYARTLANLPANHLTPEILAKEVYRRFHKKKGFQVEIYDEKKIRKLGMRAFLCVAQGSAEPPRFILIHYNSGQKDAKTVGIIGKGVTFDSGGISIKPFAGMEEMKYDMAGAAAVIGVMDALAKVRPAINVTAAIPATENLPGGEAVKPGDVVRAYNGKTIEIINTDAEGRLLLADALSFVETEYKPDFLIDFATLTGSVVVALGNEATGLFGNHADFIKKILQASNSSGEPVWEMPMWEAYQRELESEVADLKNVGGREAGSITAAKFLESFVASTPWAHLDIAGTAYGLKNKTYLGKGATGVGVRLTFDLLQQLI